MTPLRAIFPESKPGEDEVLPSLQHISLRVPDGGDWSPLTAFLARRASSGGRLSSLTVFDSHMCPEMNEHVASMVQVFQVGQSQRCPLMPIRNCVYGHLFH